MPKIIANLENRLVEEARKQVEQSGYGAVTIRSVASACGVGVGTVYNYFPSKDALLATYMLRDWKECITAISAVSAGTDAPEAVLRCIFDQLNQYVLRNKGIIQDETAAAAFAGSFGRYHSLLRSQLAQPLGKFCSSDFSAEFMAEAMLTWTTSGKTFDEIYGIMKKLF